MLIKYAFYFLIVGAEIWASSWAVEENVKQSLVQFMEKLSSGNRQNNPNWGWNMSSDPCKDIWVGVLCDSQSQTVRRIFLDEFNFNGSLDASSLCMVDSLAVLSLRKNKIFGVIPDEIGNCKNLTHLFLTENRFSGPIPEAISMLSNLKRLDISKNYLSGKIASLSRISGLVSFLAQDNQLTGEIPDFNFSNLQEFNVSNNKLTGPIPDRLARFSADSFHGNPGLCGYPLSACPPSAAPAPSPLASSISSTFI